VVDALRECTGALAAWEAGSAAFGRADEASDLDVCVLCIRGAGTHVLDRIGEQLAGIVGGDPIDTWDVGRSAFGVQRFWRPAEGADRSWCMVDVSVMEHERERDLWRELLLPERHGRALELHDPEGVLARARTEAHFDADAHRERIRAELSRIAERRRMSRDFPAKELARGRILDGFAMHHSMVTTPLVGLLGMRHRPLRFDFGLRYLHDELPRDIAQRLVPIALPGAGARALAAATEAGFAWIDELLADLDADALPIERHSEQMRSAFG
jgi:predicted nucleotidyltransferase